MPKMSQLDEILQSLLPVSQHKNALAKLTSNLSLKDTVIVPETKSKSPSESPMSREAEIKLIL
jgi:hypothetical protein